MKDLIFIAQALDRYILYISEEFILTFPFISWQSSFPLSGDYFLSNIQRNKIGLRFILIHFVIYIG